MDQEHKWINAFADITKEHIDFIEEKMKYYHIEEYLISYEDDPRPHFHLMGFTYRKNWDNFMKTLVEKFNLRTKREKGKRGGKVKYGTDNDPVKNLENFKSYCLKQTKGDLSGVRAANINQDELLKYYENSYEKTQKKKIYEEIHEDIEQNFYSKEVNLTYSVNEFTGEHYDKKFNIIKKLKLYIINYLRINTDINMCKSNVNSYTQYHLKKTNKYTEYDKDELIYTLLFN